ncbi:hypothetical protein [Hugenholtzia roseola]|uniref:hypothetical protein n=1 Tax=Hugenholtzia roseola TaxID=1002 RepID=UPI0004791259|nr:hypothetical protein [Hugenholtzia roseola]
MIIYNSPYIELFFFEEDSCLEWIWTPKSEDLTEVSFKQEFMNCLALIKTHKPQKMLADSSNQYFTVAPDLQEWVSQHVFLPSFKVGLTYIAIVLSKDVFAQLSIEQAMTEEGSEHFHIRYFDNRNEAKAWLNSQFK